MQQGSPVGIHCESLSAAEGKLAKCSPKSIAFPLVWESNGNGLLTNFYYVTGWEWEHIGLYTETINMNPFEAL